MKAQRIDLPLRPEWDMDRVELERAMHERYPEWAQRETEITLVGGPADGFKASFQLLPDIIYCEDRGTYRPTLRTHLDGRYLWRPARSAVPPWRGYPR